MPFKLPQIPGVSKPASQQSEATLDDILTTKAQKAELVVLISACIERMRLGLNATFAKGQAQSSQHAQESEHEPERKSLDLSWLQGDGEQLQKLRKSALEYHDKWETSVLHRVEEALKLKLEDIRAAGRSYHSTGDSVPALPKGLDQLDEKAKAIVLGAALFMLLSLEHYTAHSRVLMTLLCQSFALPHDVLSTLEVTSAATLLDAASKGIDAEDARKKEAEEGSFGRKWKVGLAGVAGAIAIGITGGLAAPVILGLAGTIMSGVGLGGLVTFLGATIANPVVIGAMFGMYGGKMTSRAMDAYAKEVNDFKFLPVSEIKPEPPTSEQHPASEKKVPQHKLRVAIGISGWVIKESDVAMPWRVFSSASLEPFALRYELDILIKFSTGLLDLLKSYGFAFVRGKAIAFLLPALAAAMAPLALLKAGRLVDNPFSIAIERSDQAGRVLARALIDKAQGERPVTLVGYSMGARVVFACLQELAARKAFGLVENVVLIGAPVPTTESSWRTIRAVVAGRVVNVYSEHDVILGYLYRTRNLTLSIAGLEEIKVPRVENLDVSKFVSGHNQYRLAVGRILEDLNFADLDHEQIKQEKADLEHEKIYEEEEYQKAKKDGRLEGIEDEHGQIAATEDMSKHKPQGPDASAGSKELDKKLERVHLNH